MQRGSQFVDFRRFLREKIDDIDTVVVSTTEHTHAFATLPALQARKHDHCEKPLTRDVRECRIITEAAAKAGVQTFRWALRFTPAIISDAWSNSFSRVPSERSAKPILGQPGLGMEKPPPTTPQGSSSRA